MHPQDASYTASLTSPQKFWSHQAAQLTWSKSPTTTLSQTIKTLPSGATHPHWTWFPDGEINTCTNCLDRHVDAGNGDRCALVWDSPVTGRKARYSYGEVLEEVKVLAGVLREEGVGRGDRVVVYSELDFSSFSFFGFGEDAVHALSTAW